MRPLFTVQAGEYLVGEHIEGTYPRWKVWIPSKDTGVDLLVTGPVNRKMVSLQVKSSKDYNTTDDWPLGRDRILADGWWTPDPKKIQESSADFWIFVLPSFAGKQTSFIIVPPAELWRRLRGIHGTSKKRIHCYLTVTKTRRCWETRGLAGEDYERMALDRFSDRNRDFTMFLNAWKQIEKALR